MHARRLVKRESRNSHSSSSKKASKRDDFSKCSSWTSCRCLICLAVVLICLGSILQQLQDQQWSRTFQNRVFRPAKVVDDDDDDANADDDDNFPGAADYTDDRNPTGPTDDGIDDDGDGTAKTSRKWTDDDDDNGDRDDDHFAYEVEDFLRKGSGQDADDVLDGDDGETNTDDGDDDEIRVEKEDDDDEDDVDDEKDSGDGDDRDSGDGDDAPGDSADSQPDESRTEILDTPVDDDNLLKEILGDRRCKGKEHMVRELFAAGEAINAELCDKLPLWSHVTELYGDGPVVIGLETCKAYRETIARDGYSPMPKLTGLWNTATTALSRLFLKNLALYDPDWEIHRATVPWGKHTVLANKYKTTWKEPNPDSKDHVLVVCVVRDPYRWLSSMCKQSYGAKWARGEARRCPNLLPKSSLEKQLTHGKDSFEVTHTNAQSYYRYKTRYHSLAEMWTRWNRDYFEADFPRLIIRSEDLYFYPRDVMRIIAECSGMPMRDPFEYITNNAKGVYSTTTLVDAMIKYGSRAGRLSTKLAQSEVDYLKVALDPELMQRFNYPYEAGFSADDS